MAPVERKYQEYWLVGSWGYQGTSGAPSERTASDSAWESATAPATGLGPGTGVGWSGPTGAIGGLIRRT
jgi:hypothetical protein